MTDQQIENQIKQFLIQNEGYKSVFTHTCQKCKKKWLGDWQSRILHYYKEHSTNGIILQEDDCALDARPYFIDQFEELTMLNFQKFTANAHLHSIDDGYTMMYDFMGLRLYFSADDPYYTLRLIPTEDQTTENHVKA